MATYTSRGDKLAQNGKTATAEVVGDGLKITLSAMGHGMTVDKNGRGLLPHPFVFQCGPMEQYVIAHTFSFGTYDTIDDDQFSRRGSRQLDTWQFDTLMMYLGTDMQGKVSPGWVPFPHKQPHSSHKVTTGIRTGAGLEPLKTGVLAQRKHQKTVSQQRRPEWYVDQLRKLFYAGSPFKYTAAFENSTVIHTCYANIVSFSEDYKHGEGDAIYLDAVSFQEWRDPRGETSPRLPAHVKFRHVKGRWLAYNVKNEKLVKTQSKTKGTTLKDLSRDFYGSAEDWRNIHKRNKLKGGSGTDVIVGRWGKNKIHGDKCSLTLVVPRKPHGN